MTTFPKTILALCCICLLTWSAGAQEAKAPATTEDPARLGALLQELSKFSPKAWEQRLATMRKAAEQHVAEAKRLRDEAKRLEGEAAKRDAAAKAVQAEIEQMARLRQLLDGMKFDASATEPAKPAAGAAEKAKPEMKAEATAEKPEAEMKAEAKPAAADKPKPEMKAEAKPAAAEKPKAEAQEARPMPKAGEGEPAAAPAMAAAASEAGDAEGFVTYDDHMLLIFEDNCTVCHEAGDASGGLDLSTYAAAIQGGGSGETIKPGNVMGSRLHALVSHREKPTMPPDEPRLEKEIIDTIARWIEQGAPENEAHARRLAAERAKARAAAAAEAKARAAELPAGERPAILPADWPAVELQLREHPPALRAVAWSPTAPVIAAPGHDQVLMLHAETMARLGVLDFPFGQVESLRFTADGARLVAAGGIPGQTGGAAVYDVKSGVELGRYGTARDSMFAAVASLEGDRVAVGGTRERVDVFDVESGKVLFRVEHDDWVQCIDLSADGRLLASSDRSGLVRVTELRTGRDLHEFRGHDGAVPAVAFSPDASMLVTGGVDKRVRGWRLSDGREIWNERRHGGEVLDLCWTDAEHLVSTDSSGVAVFWKRNQQLGVTRVAQDWVYGVAAGGKQPQAVAVDFAGGITLLDAKERKPARRLEPFAIDPSE